LSRQGNYPTPLAPNKEGLFLPLAVFAGVATGGFDGMADNYIQVTREDFSEQVLHARHLVIVNFSREQSAACQIQDPEFEAVSKDFLDRIIFARLNIQGQNDFTNQWHVDSVPTLVFFKDGREVYRITGVVMRYKLRRKIEGVLLVNESS